MQHLKLVFLMAAVSGAIFLSPAAHAKGARQPRRLSPAQADWMREMQRQSLLRYYGCDGIRRYYHYRCKSLQ